MAQYEAFSGGGEVNGDAVLSVVHGVPEAFEQKARRILAENGIDDPAPDEWYAQQEWLDAFAKIEDDTGKPTLKQIGTSIPENTDWQEDAGSVVEGLVAINEVYQANHRGGDVGYYAINPIDDTTVQVECKNPYACAFDEGIIKATAMKLADSCVPSVTEIGDECRTDGGDKCLYEVSW